MLGKLKGVKERGYLFIQSFKIILSKHFVTIGVKATGLKSFIVITFSFLGTGIIFEVFQMLGMEEVDKDRLNIYMRINMTQL